MRIELTVPSLLANTIGGEHRIFIEATTLADALRVIAQNFPLLPPHLYDDAGNIRRHLMIYLNDESITWLNDWYMPLKEGDRIQIIQSVSGGIS